MVHLLLRLLHYNWKNGTEVSRFKGSDGKSHGAARVLERSAARKDGNAVIADFAML